MDPYGSYTVDIGFCQDPVSTVDSVKEIKESTNNTGFCQDPVLTVDSVKVVTESTIHTGSCVDCAGSLWIVMDPYNL